MSKRKLLLADDSETVQKVVNLTFDLEGIEVITFGDGDSAMAQFAAVAPDVVLADVNMPGLSGYEICRNIKSDAATKHIPVILLVGSFEPFDEEKSMQVGADDYLTKPFQSIRQLVTKVNELISPNENKDSDEFEFNKTLEMEKKSFSDSDFGNPGMDDEMIQTSQMPSPESSETADYQSPNDFQNAAQIEDISNTQPLSAADWQDTYLPESKADEGSAQTVYELAEDQDDLPVAVQDSEEFTQPDEKIEELTSESAGFDSSFEANQTGIETEDSDIQPTNLKVENDFGIQPDDIDHFYKEPDYEEEEAVEIPVFADDKQEIHSAAETQQNAEPETGFEVIESDSPATEESVSFAAPSQNEKEENVFESSVAEEKNVAAPINTEPESFVAPAPVQPQTFSTAHDLNLDDFDLLEESFYKKVETPIVEPLVKAQEPVIKTGEPETQIVTVGQDDENGGEQVKNEISEQQLSGINLSQADIDAIAEKVVEKLTARMKE